MEGNEPIEFWTVLGGQVTTHYLIFFYLLHLITLNSIQKDVFYRIHMPIIWHMPVNIVCLQLKQAQMVTLKQ